LRAVDREEAKVTKEEKLRVAQEMVQGLVNEQLDLAEKAKQQRIK
jgi:hypothetical protein